MLAWLPAWGADLHIAQQMPLTLTISCSCKSRLVLTFLVLPLWYLLTRVDPDIFQTSSKTVVCVCVDSLFAQTLLSFLWSTYWSGTLHFILHAFLHPIIVFFSQHMPIPSQPVFLQYQDYVIQSQSLSQPFTQNSISKTTMKGSTVPKLCSGSHFLSDVPKNKSKWATLPKSVRIHNSRMMIMIKPQ